MFYRSNSEERSPLSFGRVEDLHVLPKMRDKVSYLYVEHAKIEKQDGSIAIWDADGCTPAPVAGLALLMLGPGTGISHAAVLTLCDNNCLVVWCGQENVRFYASGTGGTRSARALLHQARIWADEAARLGVVKRMYQMRFGDTVDATYSVEQLRGLEGARVRDTYARMSKETGVPWAGRNYDRSDWKQSDPVNRALSCANACLYGLCHAAILSAGYSPGIGFIHTGKGLSFVYDIADLYKVEISIPVAFQAAASEQSNLERAVRLRCRDIFRESKLLQRVIPDIQKALDAPRELLEESPLDDDPALPTELWTPASESMSTHGEDDDRPEDRNWAEG